jgi:hypothetical protein
MTLERFQEATVQAAVAALTRKGGSRRFLIADEVGLGKTVTAKAIAAELETRKEGPLNIVYLCPNLGIATQNLAKFSKLEDAWCPAKDDDRLSLVLRDRPRRRRTGFRIYAYTPDTSLPGWKPGQFTGRMAERDLIAPLLREVAPALWKKLLELDGERESEGRRRWFTKFLGPPPAHLTRPFAAALRELTGLERKPLDAGLQTKLRSWKSPVPELILRCRAALALTALRDPVTRPDLLILDEFHRYADLLVPSGSPPTGELERERQIVQSALVRALIAEDDSGPALLLLSATPYRLQRLDHGEIPGGRYGHFVKLVRFLHGQKGAVEADRTELAINAHHHALSRRDDAPAALSEVAAAKRDLERLLRPVIARTERATSIRGELFDRCESPTSIEADDLVTFRHLARAVARRKGALRSWVQPLWSSVPYPAETLFRYQICKALGSDLPPVTIASAKERPAHPQLRALVDPNGRAATTLSSDALALPWLAPTRPWWKLGGEWARLEAAGRLRGKALLFSRFVGTPGAVATWLSGELERRVDSRKAIRRVKAQAYLRPDIKAPWPLIALFIPWPTLSGAFEPARGQDLKLSDVRRRAREDLEAWLKNKKIRITRAEGRPRKPWRLAFDLEGLLGDPDQVTACLWQLGKLVRPGAWRLKDVPRTISKAELVALSDWMLGAPGVIIARTLRRHSLAEDLSSDFPGAFKFCWRQLRPHLGQRYFAATVLGSRRRKIPGGYPEALRQALLDGGLEATLDEHVAVMMLIGDEKPLSILAQSIVGRPGRVQRRTTRGIRPARVHAAVPYLGAERHSKGSKTSEKLRADTLRKAFNAPFWPHVLATTSIGQEGLDFHVWCDRVVHWDLPRDPVDFEQREGRISRYASLGVRRALAQKYSPAELTPWSSPFQAIFDVARAAKREGLGLERWWSPSEQRPISITFSLPFSRSQLKLTRLREELVSYRLALGQPEPQLFEAMIKHFGLDSEAARELALNLSPANLESRFQSTVT